MLDIRNIDCMELMAQYPDKYFDLAICDPPYGIGHSTIAGKQSGSQYGNAAAAKRTYTVKDWDNEIPDEKYFAEVRRVSKNQIIWGANNMVVHLPNSTGWIFWDKDNGDNNFSDGELAFTSFEKGLRKVKVTWNGMIQYDMKQKEERIHHTQKPIRLYQWLLDNYAEKGFKVLDTHLGSGSIAIACHYFGCDLTATEIDKEYFDKATKRIKNETAQTQLPFNH